ncbi:UbiA prenyltransferase [Mycena belliarum]|uniref:4-hydroxybenzoate polyprenyltransferase, mitochondrial n=1 Tax=Mycena belliarum TaxID=1033014 RepID=A0AAD6U1P3_9AGAR|nr:UbiA prenyltransferase [Mycena belliae]
MSTILSRHVPSQLYVYIELIRLEKPTGVILAFWPFAWGIFLASSDHCMTPAMGTSWLVMFFSGSFLLRSTACTWNDILDRKFDRLVERTKDRPIASGKLAVFNAAVFLSIEVALCILFFAFLRNSKAFWLGMFSLFPLVSLYPLLKRYTYWPQAWLGVTANWGLLIAYLTLTDVFDYRRLLPLLTGAWWSVILLIADTIYACQDKNDDAQAGVKSTALKFGNWAKPILLSFIGGFVLSLIFVGILEGHTWRFYATSTGSVAAHLVWQLWIVDLNKSPSCAAIFRQNSYTGFLVLAGFILDYQKHSSC